ncbi:MAG: glycosyl transferase group 1, partial [uncultured bacterium]
HHDGIPNIILEAAASECAIITSPIGGVGEVIKNNKTGVVLDRLNESSLTQSIEELINNEGKQLSLGKSARLLVIDQYSWIKVAKRMSGFTFKVLDHP